MKFEDNENDNVFLLLNTAVSTFILIFLAMLIIAFQVPPDAMLQCAVLPALFIMGQLILHWARVKHRTRRENAPVPPLTNPNLQAPRVHTPLQTAALDKSPYACRVHRAGDLNDDRYQIGEENVYIGDDGELYYYEDEDQQTHIR
jgi:hypothetical protein